MDIIDKLILQLFKIKTILLQEKSVGLKNSSYKICENEYNFLDKHKLQEYLTKTDIKNFVYLKEIAILCKDINEILDNEFLDLPENKTHNNANDFNALYLEEKNIIEYKTIEEKIYFSNSFVFIDVDIFDLMIICNEIFEWLNKAYPNLFFEEVVKNKKDKDHQYPRIFKDSYSFRLFERLFNDYKNSINLLADFSFIYRKMEGEGCILVKPEEFKLWLSKEPFSIVLEHGLKTLENCYTEVKGLNYNNSKELAKLSIS
jgi:hypothetical protein